ncbi:peptidase M15A protein [Salinisphaera shabanensis E1L3A]|uniref:Peptidase M15A protein n=2 Tax=Salinisphaera shabanensis TaxID=180542 RepID=U2G2C4_9GAMM|nr:peptidase M15A protein [Salinisphaera shabanensis E1L3A]
MLCAALCVPVAQARLTLDDSLELGQRTAAEFALTIDGEPLPRAVRAIFVMPGERVDIVARELSDGADLVLQTSGAGVLESGSATQWRWQAPREPGLYPLAIYNRDDMSRMRLNVFVKKPYDASRAELDGYRIGPYEPQGLRGRASSAPPDGLVQVTRANRDVALSEHFTLGQFLCHQQPDHWPKYVLVRPRLLEKLERLHTALAEAGFDLDTITVMSGYRTPWYNADIGNTTVYSQHLFGSAADIFVDANGDGRMDDLNSDSRIDTADARWLADLVEAVVAEHPPLAGGMSVYPANSRHGPFVHIDVRGMRVRW